MTDQHEPHDSLDDLRYRSQTNIVEDHREGDRLARMAVEKARAEGADDDLGRALCQKVIRAALANTITYDEAIADLSEAHPLLRGPEPDPPETLANVAIAAVRFATAEQARGHSIPGAPKWAHAYLPEAQIALHIGHEVHGTWHPFGVMLSKHAGLLALQEGRYIDAYTYAKAAQVYAQHMRAGTGRDPQDELVEKQTKDAEDLLQLALTYPLPTKDRPDLARWREETQYRLIGQPILDNTAA